MTIKQDMRQIIRTVILLVALILSATGKTWAVDNITQNGLTVFVERLPNDDAGSVDVNISSGGLVTLIVSPTGDYKTNINMIKAEKMVDPNSTRGTSVSMLGNLIVSGSSDDDISYPGSGTYTFSIPEGYGGAYVTVTFFKNTAGFTPITSLNQITAEDGNYEIVRDIDASSFSTSIATFSGTLEAAIDPATNMPYRIYNLSVPMFTALTGTVKNLVLEDVSISVHSGNTGAIACTANGVARIYNVGILSGSVGGTAYTGGLVGFLDGTARVINCYSFADITGGSDVGGIVGYNNVTTTSANNNQKTMVMNCMFYGDITGGTTISPIYGGKIISNAGNTGVGNYNYFRLEAPYVQPTGVTYNCALGAEDRFLKRFEFYRHLLNSHRELAGWWATGTYSSSDMMKWVLEPSQLDSDTPYPILKVSGKYPSVVNIDAENAPLTTERNKGGKLGTLTVNIQMGDGAVYQRPSGAQITTSQLTLNITDKDPDHYNFNYYKVQLPYYNDVGTKNYNGNRVVTGWKIVSITGGTPGTFTASDTWGGYNFADRNCTNKDLYGTGGSNRIFNQGAYWDVPEGVSAITIEPYWAKCVYLADPNADKVYKSDMSEGFNVSNVGGGQIYTNGSSYSIAGEDQVVYTSIGNAIASSGSALFSGYTDAERNNQSVYDYAVVLVGNYHHYYTTGKIEASKSKPYTVTSIDLDDDNEPDYSYMLRFDGRTECHPVRLDFINIPGLGMAQKSTGGTGSYNFGILIPKGWYESTNTSLLRFTQFEYEHKDRSTTDAIIVQGGVMEQWVSNNQKGTSNKIPYIHVGGNVWFKEFHTGCHQDKQIATKHSPISVTGGDYDEFYLTGLYRGDVTSKGDNAECYINGGRFGTICGAAMEGIGNADGASNTGNITWQIQNADIHEFYAGGLNAAKPVTGNLSTTIVDSHVDIFCGGPKFGDMSDNKTVVTNATGCTFGTFFGAGYGGNSYSRFAPNNQNSVTNINWNNWISSNYSRAYNGTYGGVSTQFSYQFLPMSDNKTNVARIFVDFVKFSLATCRNVTSTLTGCKITGNFYGGGSLGKVDGPVTSTLTNCEVSGSVFGAGFSASHPTVEADDINGFSVEPYYYTALGTYRTGVKGATTAFTWEHKDVVNSTETAIDKKNNILYTTEDLTSLGTVTGLATLNIYGSTTVFGSVYGGGEESNVNDNTNVNICAVQDQTDPTKYSPVSGEALVIHGNVFGGGKGSDDNFLCDKAMVGVNDDGKCADPGSNDNRNKGTSVRIGNGTVNGNVYGGGEVGRVEWNTQVTIGIKDDDSSAPVIHGSVFGAGAGKETHGYSALVRGNSTVTVLANAKVLQNVYGGGEMATVGRYWVKGISTTLCPDDPNETAEPTPPDGLPDGMPYQQRRGGICNVTIQGNAQIGPDNGGTETAGHVFGAGKGVVPQFNAETSKKMVKADADNPDRLVAFTAENGKTAEDAYLEFLQTLALVTNSYVTIDGSATVKGSVYGGSESGFVQHDTNVTINSNCKIGTSNKYGDVYGGGKGLPTFAEAGKVKGNTILTLNNGTIYGNVYGGGSLGDVGKINKDSIMSYKWTDDEITATNYKNYAYNNTGVCNVNINGGTIGTDGNDKTGHVFGAGQGLDDTYYCEKAMAYKTNVIITDGTIKGSVYGGGQIGRVENNATVTIGLASGSGEGNKPDIQGNVFGAGAGLETHGYSALLRGNTEVTIQGIAKVGGSVFGGGETASVGRFKIVDGLPTAPLSGGTCKVTVTGNAKIGTSGTDHNVFGSCKGVAPFYVESGDDRSKCMQTYENRPEGSVERTDWDYIKSYGDNFSGQKYVWVYFTTKAKYLEFLRTLALASNTDVTISGTTSACGSVYGGGQRGITLGNVEVKISGGTIEQDVYGGGALADTNTGNPDGVSDTYTTTVNLIGGSIKGDAYGGGLGQLGTDPIEAKVYGDITVKLGTQGDDGNATKFYITKYDGKDIVKSGRVFGCNNLNGSPQGDVTVEVYKTVKGSHGRTEPGDIKKDDATHSYNLAAVYGGGNLADYTSSGKKASVKILDCDISIQEVYGGGNAAEVPETDVLVSGAYEIETVFGGGNGRDSYTLDGGSHWITNPGANIRTNTNTLLTGGTIHEAYGGSNELGTIYGSATINSQADKTCPCLLDVSKVVGAGKNADILGDAITILDCMPEAKVDEIYGGADNANVHGKVELTITSGNFGKVFGGNNSGGIIKGHIRVNIEETNCIPIKIDELYLGGNMAAYSIYGYYDTGETTSTGKPIYEVRKTADDTHTPVPVLPTDPAYDESNPFVPYDDPELNIISCTSIGEVYGGGYGTKATLYGNPTVNINMIPGVHADEIDRDGTPGADNDVNALGEIGTVFGGGNAADVVGNTTVNIGTTEKVTLTSVEDDPETTTIDEKHPVVQGAYITGNVYGGGNKAKVTGNTTVVIGKQKTTEPQTP